MMSFAKMHGCGNDFVILRAADVDDLALEAAPLAAWLHRLCDRHYGIGSDGLLLGPLPSAECDFALRRSGNGFARGVARRVHAPGELASSRGISEDVQRDHGPLAAGMARGTAALIKDLKQRGLLDDTIVLWTTGFGRMPSTQGSKGRDHNPNCFTNWLCGGGIRPGVTYGPSDAWGYKPLDRDNPTQVYDIHATMLHLLGIDHKRLTFRHNGIDSRLTDVHGHVIQELLG